MWCDAQFSLFNVKVRLDETRRGRINSAIQSFSSFCQSDSQLAAALAGAPFLQGSVTTKTAVKPLDTDEFDVDIVYPFSIRVFEAHHQNPASVIQWFKSRLEVNRFYAPRLKPRDRCARVDYAGDFHLDIIPATADLSRHQPYGVPASDIKDWVTSNPVAFAEWVNQKDNNGGGYDANGEGYFVRSVRFVKRWRDHYFSREASPSSMLLVTLLGKHDPSVKTYFPSLEPALFPEYQHDGAYIYDMLRLTSSCLRQENRRVDAFENPTVRGEDLARDWSIHRLDEFLNRLDSCIFFLGEAIFSTSEAESILYYRRAFGDSFPAR